MSLSEIGNVLYYGVFASFCGGWVPVRSKNLKLILFHLYVFISLLVLPLLVVLVNGSRPLGWVGWLVYSLFTGGWFIFLKVLNFRLHEALGTDPVQPEEVSEHDSTPPQPNDNDDDTTAAVNGDGGGEDTGQQQVQASSSTTEVTHEPVANKQPDKEDSISSNSVVQTAEETASASLQHSASTLNETRSETPVVDGTTPTIELSTMSHEVDLQSITESNDATDTFNSPAHKPADEDSETAVEIVSSSRASSGTRERICQRMSRNESVNSRHDNSIQLDNERDLIEQVKRKLLSTNHQPLVNVIDKMPSHVQTAIASGAMLSSNLDNLRDRVETLNRGHLAVCDEDESPGAIHWFEESGVWEFYTFGMDDNLLPPAVVSALQDSEEDWPMRIEQELPVPSFLPRHDTPPPIPPLISHVTASNEPSSSNSSSLPSIMILPRVKWTKVTLKFVRSQLEEFMDRNVSITEVVLSIVLAVLVCVVGSLLFSLTNFFKDFWLFWLCFVIATSQFSLIKSVQSDPSSPGPGQNRVNAISRAAYFVFFGTLGLIVNAVITPYSQVSPICFFGFDFNSESVLMFVRNAIFIFLLFFPLLFTIGWMPQFDTFLINLLEQIDVHVFGGTASTGLVCGLYALGRSLAACLLLVPLGYAGFVFLEEESRSDIPVNGCEFTYRTFSDDNFPDSCTLGGRIALSFFLGGVVSLSYFLSRSTSNHQYIQDVLSFCWTKLRKSKQVLSEDPLDRIYRETMISRLKVDIFVVVCAFFLVTLLNLTSVFCQTEVLYYVFVGLAVVVGIINHYFVPHTRKENPYLCFTEPCLKSEEYSMFEVTTAPEVTWAEKLLQVTLFLEKNILYPVVFLLGLNFSAVYYQNKFGSIGAAVLVAVVGLKVFRTAFSDIARQHIVLILSFLFFNFDYRHLSEGSALNYFVAAIFVNKLYDLYLKTYFMLIYIVPSSWSHPFHILIQPFLVPHCPVIFFQAVVGAIINAPMNPIIASSMFFLSYARPIKFWEKNYNTKRQDTTNTRLDQTLDGNMRNPNPDHLDSLFYEQLTWSLQRDICGDISLGRWGRVASGDIFILTNDQLNALVHIIEIGNGFVTFQLRGLEFRGTYCHQREREAITEPLTNDDDSCHLPFVLPCKKLCVARWMAWEVVSSSYTLHGYSITENQAHLVFNAYIYKKAFITYYVRCIIYHLIKSPRLMSILGNNDLKDSLTLLSCTDSVDVDPLFTEMYNADWDLSVYGITRSNFVTTYYELIKVCCEKNKLSHSVDTSRSSFLVTLCFAFSLLGRRMFLTHANTGSTSRGDNFMHGLYRMFIGDARPNSEKDDWIFQDIDSIQEIIIPAARVALKVHQDNFTTSERYESPLGMFEAMWDAETNHVITHENDRSWRDAVVLNKPSLLALRYQRSEDTYINPYKIIRLNSRFVKFRLVKVNRECVRGLWSSQQHELIFLRNSDSERGSIQNHKASLRNMINSSMDLPIGYPIYVSPLQTSFLDQHKSFNKTLVGQVINPLEYTRVIEYTQRACVNCLNSSQSEPSTKEIEPEPVTNNGLPTVPPGYIDPYGDDDSSDDDDFWKPIHIGKTVTIINVGEVFETFNEGWLQWPDKGLLRKATKSHWKQWRPLEGVTCGEVVHEWRPFHFQSTSRSHIDKVIVLIKVANSDNYVLVKEQGIEPSS